MKENIKDAASDVKNAAEKGKAKAEIKHGLNPSTA